MHDLRPGAARDHLVMGATWADTPRAMIDHVNRVVSMVFGPPQCEAILRGPNGIIDGDCAGNLWIDMTTSSPRFMRALVQEFVPNGGKRLDAPVTGSVDAVIRGDLPMLLVSEDADIEAVRSACILGELAVQWRQ